MVVFPGITSKIEFVVLWGCKEVCVSVWVSFLLLTEFVKVEEALQLYECVLRTAVENFIHHKKAATSTSERDMRRGGGRERGRGREKRKGYC